MGPHWDAWRLLATWGAPLGRSTKWVVSAGVAVTLVLRRDLPTCSFVMGACLNGVLSKVLKRLLNQKRPEGSEQSDPGMPSSHAQSLFFIGGYAIASLDPAGPPPWLPMQVHAARASLAAYVCLASLWRVAVAEHTLPQVIKNHQRGVQWKQGVGIYMIYTSLLYNTTPIHCTPLPLHPPVMRTQVTVGAAVGSAAAAAWSATSGTHLAWLRRHLPEQLPLSAVCALGLFGIAVVGSLDKKLPSLLAKWRVRKGRRD